jgi:uncharacterized protein (DUF362 family)
MLNGVEERLRDLETLCSADKVNRRRFLKVAVLIAAALALPAGCGSPRPTASSSAAADVSDVLELNGPPAPTGYATVGIVRSGDIAAMVNRAIELAGGLGEIRSGDTVVIKPNLTTGYKLATRVTTHPEVLREVIRAVKQKTDAKNITVAEASSYADPSTLEVARKVGVYDVVQSEGVNFLAWETEEYVEATSYLFQHIQFRLLIPKSLTDSRFKHFINVPMLKNHDVVAIANADYTCCLKNHVGVLAREKRTRGGGNGIHQDDLGEKIAEINLAVPKHTMNVVDALTVVLEGGPASTHMKYTNPGLILASKDRVACDSVALAVLRYYASQMGISRPYVEKSVWDQAQIVRAQELKLGRRKNRIKVAGEGIAEIDGILAQWS